MKKINRISVLKALELLLCVITLLLITKNFWMPEAIIDKMYNFGLGLTYLLIFLCWLSIYFSIAIKEKEYLRNKFSTESTSKKLLLMGCIIMMYLFSMYVTPLFI